MSDNFTLALPPGTTNHGNPKLLCLPTKWTDVVIFFLGNYVAHAATIRLEPGISKVDTILAVIWALLIPISGVRRGFDGIFSLANFGNTDLQVAARAGALCKVIRTDQQARSQRERLLTLENTLFAGKIHGLSRLPPGYGLAIVPRDSKFQEDDPDGITIALASNWNVVAVLVAMAQLLFAIATLYRARGDQTARYGYAAFGLTVTQYAMMSLLNILGNLMCPQYPCIYLVRTQEMTDAERESTEKGKFEGIVGTLLEDEMQKKERVRREAPLKKSPSLIMWQTIRSKLWQLPFQWFPTAVSVAVIYALSHFERGSSTYSQRVWTMAWLGFGSYVGALGGNDGLVKDVTTRRIYLGYLQGFIILLIGAIPSVGGSVVVAQMLNEYGICKRL